MVWGSPDASGKEAATDGPVKSGRARPKVDSESVTLVATMLRPSTKAARPPTSCPWRVRCSAGIHGDTPAILPGARTENRDTPDREHRPGSHPTNQIGENTRQS